MKIVSTRLLYTTDATRGILAIDGDFFGYCLEDAVRAPGVKIHGRTAIPPGIYEVGMHASPRFGKRLPHLKNVPGFEWILAHGGNKHTDTDGCLLVAAKPNGKDGIFQSLSDKLAGVIDAALKRGEKVTWQVLDSGR